MQETKEKEINEKSQLNEQQKKQEENEKKKNNLPEKKVIVYIIVSVLILLYIAQLQMHDIIDRGVISKSQGAEIVYPERNNNGNDIDWNKNNGNNGNQGNNQGNTDNPDNPENPVVDNEARIRILEGTTDWKSLKELNIFDTSKNIHVTSGKIAPGVSGKYVYTVENYGDTSMKYDFAYSEENKYNINMVYKLKRNGTYIAGNANKWVKIDELSQTDYKIEANTTDIYILEWHWEDAENDTQIGKTEGAYYKLFISSTATQI